MGRMEKKTKSDLFEGINQIIIKPTHGVFIRAAATPYKGVSAIWERLKAASKQAHKGERDGHFSQKREQIHYNWMDGPTDEQIDGQTHFKDMKPATTETTTT